MAGSRDHPGHPIPRIPLFQYISAFLMNYAFDKLTACVLKYARIARQGDFR